MAESYIKTANSAIGRCNAQQVLEDSQERGLVNSADQPLDGRELWDREKRVKGCVSQGTVLGNTSYHKEPSPVTLTFPRLITN